MPKETINPRTPNEPFQAEVGWSREHGGVQVGIGTVDHRHLVDHVYAGNQPDIAKELGAQLAAAGFHIVPVEDGEEAPFDADSLGRLILDAVTGSTPFGTSVWWHPNRTQINDLIRLLRKARDAAMGRDE